MLEDPELFRVLLESAPDPIVIVDADGRIVLVNSRVEEVFGYKRDDLVGRPIETLVPQRHRRTHVRNRTGFTANPRRRPMGMGLDLTARHRDGTEIPVDITLSPVHAGDGRLVTAIVRDMTEQRRQQERLRYLADHDLLTGLLNRSAFEVELARQSAEARRYGGGALLLIDLDGFKAVNDQRGHSAGDELLERLATAIRSRLRGTDVVARHGGDEFVVLVPRADAAQAREVAEAMVAVVAEEGRVPGPPVTASVGVALLGAGAEGDALLNAADHAMYRAKRAGGDRVEFA